MKLETAVLPMTEAEAREMAKRPLRKKPGPLDITQAKLAEAFLAGEQIIHLGDTIRAGGHHDSGMPKVAAARWGWVFARLSTTDQTTIRGEGEKALPRLSRQNLVFEQRITVPAAAGYKHPVQRGGFFVSFISSTKTATAEPAEPATTYEARVPVVPDRCLPEKTKGRELAVLFETEWTPVIQRDPALLERVAGPYWKVLATWDLTELEARLMREMTYAG